MHDMNVLLGDKRTGRYYGTECPGVVYTWRLLELAQVCS